MQSISDKNKTKPANINPVNMEETPTSADVSTAPIPSISIKTDDRLPFRERMKEISAEDIQILSPDSARTEDSKESKESKNADEDPESQFNSEDEGQGEGEAAGEEDEPVVLTGSFANLKFDSDKKVAKPAKTADAPNLGAGNKPGSLSKDMKQPSPTPSDKADDEGWKLPKMLGFGTIKKQGSGSNTNVPIAKTVSTADNQVKIITSPPVDGTKSGSGESSDYTYSQSGSLKKDLFSKFASIRKIGWGSQELPRIGSLDSVVQRPAIKPKSILKTSPSKSQVKIDTERTMIPLTPSLSSGDIADLQSPKALSALEPSPISATADREMGEPLSRTALLRASGKTGFHSSAPNLQALADGGELKKSASAKQLVFDLDNTKVLPVLSKSAYNRKPDNNMTFKKLTPKLKDEIRAELNEFKRNEMVIHHESMQNTVFH